MQVGHKTEIVSVLTHNKMETKTTKIMYWILIVITISVIASAQGTDWNVSDNMSYDDYVLFCDSQGMEYSDLKMYNYTYYIMCDTYNNQYKLQATERFIQSDANLNNKFQCNLTLEEKYCTGGVSFDEFKCYLENNDRENFVKCNEGEMEGEWEGVRV